MSKTPDTDANVWSDSCEGILCKVVSAEFARRLERERDEARFLLKQAQSSLDAIHLEVGGWIKILKENTD
jgi:hypothetical protein